PPGLAPARRALRTLARLTRAAFFRVLNALSRSCSTGASDARSLNANSIELCHRSLAPQLLGRDLCALRQRLELRPDDRRVADASAEPAVGAGDDVLLAHDFREADEPLGHELGVLDE